ncbi:PIN domain-containing protein [Candidatus Woesearchaeota archaeon]|nr:PIN domain-containing protein [Candidatus Woesearchaeota archaeon]
MKINNVMLNTNAFCRPLDDLTDKNVELEAKCAKELFDFARREIILVITSEILFYEINLIEEKDKRELVFQLAKNVENRMIYTNSDVERLADKIRAYIKDYADCLHIASAAVSNCSYLVTCDIELLRMAKTIESFLFKHNFKLHIVNPIEVVRKVTEEHGK